VVVPKPGKDDYSLPKCYRLIALLECLGKLLEKVVARCLTYDITVLSLIPFTQFGAHPHSSTIDAGLCLMHDVEMAHALRSVCGTLLFDIQGFFNNVNHAQLVALVKSLGFPSELLSCLDMNLTALTKPWIGLETGLTSMYLFSLFFMFGLLCTFPGSLC
jgi:hypothetical protein